MPVLSKPTYSQQVFDLVAQRIRDKTLTAGMRVAEQSLAEECGISRAPVREALHQLEVEGFLMTHPKRGRCVTMLTPQIVRNNYELCGLLEGAAAAQSALLMQDQDWRNMEAVLEKMKVSGYGDFSDDIDIGKANLSSQFHMLTLQYAHNRLLVDVSSKSGRVISKYLLFQEWKKIFSPTEMHDRHLSIYTAMKTKDAKRIEYAVREHYKESGEGLAATLETENEASTRKKILISK